MKALSIQKTIQKLQPALTPNKSKAIAVAILKGSIKYEIDWKLITAILFQESSLRVDPQNCLQKIARCTGDYGMGQVRYSVWAKEFDIDKNRMMVDVDYSIEVSILVLAYYKQHYANKELNWYTRYHSATPLFRQAYMKKINQAYKKINKHLPESDRLIASKY